MSFWKIIKKKTNTAGSWFSDATRGDKSQWWNDCACCRQSVCLFGRICQLPLCTAAQLGAFVEVDELAHAKPPLTVFSQLRFEVRLRPACRHGSCDVLQERSWWFFLAAASCRDSLVSRSAVRTFLAHCCFPVCPPLLLLYNHPRVWVSAGVLLPPLASAGLPLLIITVLRAAPFISLPGSCIFIGFVSTFALLALYLDFVSTVVCVVVTAVAAGALRLPLLSPLVLLLFLLLLFPGRFLWSLRRAFLCARLGLFYFSVLGFFLGRAFVTNW